MKKIFAIGLVVSFVLAGYFGVRIYSGFQKEFTRVEMDWNEDGETSLIELIEASDIGAREVKRDEKTCREFYSYKDGLPVKIICP